MKKSIIAFSAAIMIAAYSVPLLPANIYAADGKEDNVVSQTTCCQVTMKPENTVTKPVTDETEYYGSTQQQQALKELREKEDRLSGSFPRAQKDILGGLPEETRRLDYDEVKQIIHESDSYSDIASKIEALQKYPDFTYDKGTTFSEYWFDNIGRNKIIMAPQSEQIIYIRFYDGGTSYHTMACYPDFGSSTEYHPYSFDEVYRVFNDIDEGYKDIKFVLGDVNSDEKFDITDLVEIKKWMLNISDFVFINPDTADLNSDCKIDIADYCLMKQELLKQENSKKELTPDDVFRLSQSDSDLTWSDFKEYEYKDKSSDMCIWEIEIGQTGYALNVCGYPGEDPKWMYIDCPTSAYARSCDIKQNNIEQIKAFMDWNLMEIENKNISKVILTSNLSEEPVEILNSNDINRIIMLMRDLCIGKEDNSYKEYDGRRLKFDIYYADGKQTSIELFNPYVVIDGKGYITVYEPCQELINFADEILKK